MRILLALAFAAACHAEVRGTVMEDVPPAREEVVIYKPGYVWIHGHWAEDNHRWIWRGGYYERERPSEVYVQGRWDKREGRWVWTDGQWRPRGHVVER